MDVYPNPINLTQYPLKFNYILSNPRDLKISIIDLKGNKMKEENFHNLTSGRNIITISDLNYLPSGTYFILIDESETLKFINIK